MTHVHLGHRGVAREHVSCFLSSCTIFPDTFLHLAMAGGRLLVLPVVYPSPSLFLSFSCSDSMKGNESKFTERYCFSDPAASSLRGPTDPRRIVVFPLRFHRPSPNIHNAKNMCETAYSLGTRSRLQILFTDSVPSHQCALWCFEVVVLKFWKGFNVYLKFI